MKLIPENRLLDEKGEKLRGPYPIGKVHMGVESNAEICFVVPTPGEQVTSIWKKSESEKRLSKCATNHWWQQNDGHRLPDVQFCSNFSSFSRIDLDSTRLEDLLLSPMDLSQECRNPRQTLSQNLKWIKLVKIWMKIECLTIDNSAHWASGGHTHRTAYRSLQIHMPGYVDLGLGGNHSKLVVFIVAPSKNLTFVFQEKFKIKTLRKSISKLSNLVSINANLPLSAKTQSAEEDIVTIRSPSISPVTLVTFPVDVNDPLPSWPSVAQPHANTAPFLVRNKLWSRPHLI